MQSTFQISHLPGKEFSGISGQQMTQIIVVQAQTLTWGGISRTTDHKLLTTSRFVVAADQPILPSLRTITRAASDNDGSKTMSTGRLVAITHCLVFISIKFPSLLLQPVPGFVLRCGIAFTLHILAYWALAIAAEGTKTSTIQARTITEYEKHKGARDVVPDVKQIGWIAAVYSLVLPYLSPEIHPWTELVVRVSCFFLACKVVDLVALKAQKPPKLVSKSAKNDVVDMKDWKRKVEYVARVFTEARYASFDIAIDDKSTRKLWQEKHSERYEFFWLWGPRIIIPIVALLFPVAELQILLVLVIISSGLEFEHALLHPYCPNYMFLAPFAASGMTEFWAVHWHQGAQSWLISVGFRPSKWFAMEVLRCSKDVGNAVGVLGTFALSGLWHAWCAAVLSERPWMAGTSMFLVFVSQGVGCLLERRLWKNRDPNWVMKMISWTFAIECGALWLRCMVPTLKEGVLLMSLR